MTPTPTPTAPAADAGLVRGVRAALAEHTDAERASGQQRYMKSTMPYRGVPMPLLRRIVRAQVATHPLTGPEVWEATARTLWDEAAYREERYAAIELLAHRRHRAWLGRETVPLLEHLVRSGAWWDLVDATASLVGHVVAAHPATEAARMRAWAVSEDLWLRRVAIICQLGAREATDTALLRDAVEANLEGTRFGGELFIRKAIGWALRQHARTDPAWVRALVAEHADRLSGLSRREALKHLA